MLLCIKFKFNASKCVYVTVYYCE